MLFTLSQSLWNWVLPLLLGSGAWLTWKSRGFALRNEFRRRRPNRGRRDGASPWACLCTALASTVGTGNIAGVAFALTLGGPGALVWMWISAAVCTSLKYAECALAVQYREKDRDGGWLGGPMVTLTHLPWGRLGRFLGCAYALAEVCISLTAGNLVQSSAISAALGHMAGVPAPAVGLAAGLAVLAVLSGGARSLTRFSSLLVPAMLGLYLLGGGAVLAVHLDRLPGAVVTMLREAFSLSSAGAGAFGAMVRAGVTRGCFSNDSGTGTAAFSAALTDADPVSQGLVSATANLWDTGVVCTVTGLAILVSGVSREGLNGVALTMAAYRTGLGQVGMWIVGICLVLFAFSSLPGIAFHGEQALTFLRGDRTLVRYYRPVFALLTFVGCLLPAGPALAAADLGNALLILLNLTSLLALETPYGNGS